MHTGIIHEKPSFNRSLTKWIATSVNIAQSPDSELERPSRHEQVSSAAPNGTTAVLTSTPVPTIEPAVLSKSGKSNQAGNSQAITTTQPIAVCGEYVSDIAIKSSTSPATHGAQTIKHSEVLNLQTSPNRSQYGLRETHVLLKPSNTIF